MPVPITIPTAERPVAVVVDAQFDSDTFTIDTTMIDGQRVVVMQQRDGVRYLTAVETLALSRALLSRLAYVGFPSEVGDVAEAHRAFVEAHPKVNPVLDGEAADFYARRFEVAQ
ncbi:hypothetical protein [uncultured Microbacterium sp.]|uniref:hypothetical protein n=1 Tax=uncultured Microbacterium sp. TaxID=191216 RepID=UPI0025F9933B|nr:hypothetical protein [uncultured Microbacterium sp.]